MIEKYMDIAIKEAEKAYKRGDVPVGAVIIKDNKIIAKSYNKKQKKHISTRHAEIKKKKKRVEKQFSTLLI